jgi:hypothetical protein
MSPPSGFTPAQAALREKLFREIHGLLNERASEYGLSQSREPFIDTAGWWMSDNTHIMVGRLGLPEWTVRLTQDEFEGMIENDGPRSPMDEFFVRKAALVRRSSRGGPRRSGCWMVRVVVKAEDLPAYCNELHDAVHPQLKDALGEGVF